MSARSTADLLKIALAPKGLDHLGGDDIRGRRCRSYRCPTFTGRWLVTMVVSVTQWPYRDLAQAAMRRDPRPTMRFLMLANIALLLAACAQDDTVGLATATAQEASPSASASEPTVTASPAAEPTPSPTPKPEATAPEIGFNVVGGEFGQSLMVRIHNPNEDVGLIRSGFELTAIAEDGAIIDVFGSEGFPGASCCTIYRLPPGGDFGLAIALDPSAPGVAQLELAVTDRWTTWADVEPPESELTDVNVVATEFAGPQVTGRVTTPDAAEDGPFNVWIVAFVESADGLVVVSGSVDCVATADARAFALDSFLGDAATGPYALQDVVAYTTTVPGTTEPAPGC